MSYPLEAGGVVPLPLIPMQEKSPKPVSGKGELTLKDFKDEQLKENIKFLEYIGSGASDIQVLQALYEVQPEQLAAIRNLASCLMKANKNFVTEYVRNDVEQNQGRRAYKYVRNGKRMVRVLIRHPAPPKADAKMKPASLKRVATLKKFLHNLLIQKATRPQLRARSRFIKAIVHAGLELYQQYKSTTDNTTPGKPGQNGSRKEKSKEKNRKRKAEGLRDDGDDTPSRSSKQRRKEAEGWSSAIPDNEVEQDAWFHNTYSSESSKTKKARSQSSAKNFANAKRSKKAQRDSNEESEVSEADSRESSESEGESSDGYSSE